MDNRLRSFRELEAAEAAVRATQRQVVDLFSPGFALADQVLRGYASVMDERIDASPDNLCAVAHRVLLPRLADDLRCLLLLARDGYWFQAMSLAASALEAAATVGYIAWRQDRAERWLFWKDYESMPWSVRTMIDGAVAHWSSDTDPEKAKGWKRWYTIFCWAKHGNPRFQLRLGSLSPAQHAIASVPEIEPRTEKRLFMVLYSGLQLTGFTLGGLTSEDTSTMPTNVTDAVIAFAREMNQIAARDPDRA